MTALTLNEQLAAFFRRHPNQWIDSAAELAHIAGRNAWRTRVSDLRRPPFSMRIENRVRRTAGIGGRRVTISEYRFVPNSIPAKSGTVEAPLRPTRSEREFFTPPTAHELALRVSRLLAVR